jgi:hypothetical protein
MGNTGSRDGGSAFKTYVHTTQMPPGCLCSEGIPSKNKFKYEERAKLLPEKTSALLQKRGAMATYDALVKELADSPSGTFGSWAGGAKHLWEITSK